MLPILQLLHTMQTKSLFGTTSKPAAQSGVAITSAQNRVLTQPPTGSAAPVVYVGSKNKLSNVQPFRIAETPGQELVLFGNERQKEFGAKLDGVLVQLTKGTNPILFELFNQLSKGVEGVNIPELEKEITASTKVGPFGKLLMAVGLSNASKRLQKANERVGGMLKTKSTSLLELCEKMQETTSKEVGNLINDTQKLQVLALELRQNVEIFQEYVQCGHQMLASARAELAELKNDPSKSTEVKNLEDKINLFESRVVVLETVLQKAPTDLEALRLGMNASLSTLGETANSALEDFNDIKSILIKLSVTHQIQTVQSLNDQRRALKAGLQTHANQQLQNVAVTAASAQGLNRLNDATQLMESAKSLAETNAKVKAEIEANKQRFADARATLSEIKNLMA